MIGIVVWLIILAMIAALFWMIVFGKMPSGGGGFAALTVFHDWLPKDKQRAIEVVIEQKAGKRLEEDENAAPPRPEPGSGVQDAVPPEERKSQ